MEIATPLTGDNALLFYRMHGREELSRPSEYQIELLTKEEAVVDFDKVLGENVTVRLELSDDSPRFFNGFVSRFSYGGRHGRYLKYHAVVRPWFWFLTKTSDCRIFQEMTVPDIVKKVFEDHPDADYKLELTNSYRSWNYCVQYRETDFNFVSRLLEHEGIFYYFRHTNGHHTMVLTDDVSKLNATPGCETLRFIEKEFVRPETEYVRRWDYSREVQPGKYVHTDYDLKRPSVDLQTEKVLARAYVASDYEIFDYPGMYLQHADGEATANVRIWELGSQYEAAHAVTNARGVTVGALFTLENCPRADQNCEHFIVAATYDLQFSDYEGIPEPEPTGYDCSFTAMTSQQQFRPRRITPKPFVQGPQTAVVVGPAGDEIYTDEFGRVKVKFRWDRDPKKDEKSSCWIRVSHPWAGKGWGAMAIPRIGQEVIVDFLEGDPDQPIITGRVYNAEAMPPYELPANSTQSGLVSRSSPGGNGFNEIRMEDSKDKEHLSIHAQKDMSTQVERDQSIAIGRDQSSVVKRNQSLAVTNDRSIHVKNNESHIVDVDQQLKVKGKQHNEIIGNRTTTVDGVYTLIVKGALNTDTKAARTENSTGDEKRKIGGGLTVNVTGDINYKGANMVFEAGKIGHKATTSTLHTSAGPYSIMANKFTLMSNTDASILAAGKINYTSMESNTTVMGSNSSGYMGMSSATAMGLARTTFLGMAINTFMGMQISSTLAILMEAVAAVKISASAGPHLELAALKVHSPGGGGGGGAAALGPGASAAAAAVLGFFTGTSIASAAVGFSEISDQYTAANKELREAAAQAAAAGHPGLAARLNRLAEGARPFSEISEGTPTSTQDTGDPGGVGSALGSAIGGNLPSSGGGGGTPPGSGSGTGSGGGGGTPPSGGGGGGGGMLPSTGGGGGGGTPPSGGSGGGGGVPPSSGGGGGGTPPGSGSGGGGGGGTPPSGGSGGSGGMLPSSGGGGGGGTPPSGGSGGSGGGVPPSSGGGGGGGNPGGGSPAND
jgi:type VI secretion system secreted protein VgrG